MSWSTSIFAAGDLPVPHPSPGDEIEVPLIPYGGKQTLYGFNNLVDGWVPDKLTSSHERPEKLQAIQRARDHGFKFSEPGKPSKPVNDK